MLIFKLISKLYTERNAQWITQLRDEDIQPYVIQRWLCMNDKIRVQTRWLDKYVFVLPPKMYLSLAWSIIPKTAKAPYSKYIKKVDENEEFDFILEKVRKHFQLSDNDYNANKTRILIAIKENMVDWFSFYGVPKRYWRKYQLDFRKIKEFGLEDKNRAQKGLAAFGM